MQNKGKITNYTETCSNRDHISQVIHMSFVMALDDGNPLPPTGPWNLREHLQQQKSCSHSFRQSAVHNGSPGTLFAYCQGVCGEGFGE